MSLLRTSASRKQVISGIGSVQVLTPAPRSAWQEVLSCDPHALVTQTPTWLDCICAAGPYEDASRLYETPEGAKLIMPMVRYRHLPAGLDVEASPPYSWGMGGLVASRPLKPKDVAIVLDDLRHRGMLRASIRPDPLTASAWAEAQIPGIIEVPRLAHVLDLDGGFDQVWSNRFHNVTRRNIRKAERSGLMVECDKSGRLVPVFYKLFLKSVDRWAMQQNEPRFLAHWRARRRDPISKFELIARKLGDACRIWVAWLDGEPAAAILVLQGKNAHYTRGAMNKDLAGPTRANDLLHKMAIEDACLSGCRYYHMGETGASASLASFKSKFGARPVSYAEYMIERIPLTAADHWLRSFVKKLIGFKDA